jgi:hypothetical protein
LSNGLELWEVETNMFNNGGQACAYFRVWVGITDKFIDLAADGLHNLALEFLGFWTEPQHINSCLSGCLPAFSLGASCSS